MQTLGFKPTMAIRGTPTLVKHLPAGRKVSFYKYCFPLQEASENVCGLDILVFHVISLASSQVMSFKIQQNKKPHDNFSF